MWRLVSLLLAVAALPGPAAAEPGCVALVRHLPAADVAYRPGVDARGGAVTPADLTPQTPLPAGGRVFIPITLPLGLFLDRPSRHTATSEIYVGEVEVDVASGQMWLDGEPLSRSDSDALMVWCRGEARRQSGLPPLPAEKPAPK